MVELCRISNSSEIIWLYEEDPIKNEGARVLTRLYIVFLSSRAANSEVSGGILPKFELIQAFMVVLVTCKNEEDPIKMKALECYQDFPHYKSMGLFSNAQGQLTPQSVVKSCRSKIKALEC